VNTRNAAEQLDGPELHWEENAHPLQPLLLATIVTGLYSHSLKV